MASEAKERVDEESGGGRLGDVVQGAFGAHTVDAQFGDGMGEGVSIQAGIDASVSEEGGVYSMGSLLGSVESRDSDAVAFPAERGVSLEGSSTKLLP